MAGDNPAAGMRAFPTTTLLIAFALFGGVPPGAVAVVSDSPDCAELLLPSFYSDPSKVQWKVDHRNLCPVTQQGGLSTCWASAGATLIKPFLVRAGLMRADQQLSLDYYSAVVMRSFARAYKTARDEIFMDEIGPFFTTEIYQLMMTAGVVLREEFRFPRIERVSRSGKSYFSDIRNSRSVQDDFIDELNEAKSKRNQAFYLSVLDAYLGVPELVNARPVPLELVEAHRPRLIVTTESRWNRILAENVTTTQPELVDPALIEEQVRASLDRGNPVLITVSRLEHFFRMAAKDYSLLPAANGEGDFLGEHAVSIVGYGMGPDGKTWYLYQNNSGKGWGVDGTLAISGAFLRTEVEKFVLIP